MKLNQYILLMCVLLSWNASADNGQDYLELVRNNYLNLKSASVQLDYTLYKGYTNDSVVQAYSSQYRKVNGNTYRQIGGTELINSGDVSLKIDHNQKTMIVSDYTSINYLDFDIEQTLAYCKTVKVTPLGKKNKVVMILKDQSDIPFNKIELELDKNLWISEITMYYSNQINFATSYFDQELDFPKLVVSYHQIDRKWKDKEGILQLENYIISQKNNLQPAQPLQDYQLIDIRKSN